MSNKRNVNNTRLVCVSFLALVAFFALTMGYLSNRAQRIHESIQDSLVKSQDAVTESRKRTDEAWANIVYERNGETADSWHDLKVGSHYSIKGDKDEIYHFRIARIDLGDKRAVIISGPPPTDGDQSKGEIGFGTYTLDGTRNMKLEKLEELIKTRGVQQD